MSVDFRFSRNKQTKKLESKILVNFLKDHKIVRDVKYSYTLSSPCDIYIYIYIKQETLKTLYTKCKYQSQETTYCMIPLI